jgi:hypothetical protein
MLMLTARHHSRLLVAASVAATLAAAPAGLHAGQQRFYDDDPIARAPESRDASKVKPWKNILTYDLLVNLFSTPGDRRSIRAQNINTIDEVPDSGWFTNRILATPATPAEAARGPIVNPGPVPGPMTVTFAKPEGVSPGFTVQDSAGVTWFVQFDAARFPKAATGAAMVANRIFHLLGYWQPEYHLAELRPELLSIGPKATTETPSGKIRRLDRADLDKLLEKASRQPNGAYRMLASRGLSGGLGGFRYAGTRPDDPNDIVPHEHRRELRALKVFGAWTNLVDMKAGNTLDTLVNEGGKSVVRHYLQDVGSTFGTGALAPREWDEGHEFLYEGDPTWKRLVTISLFQQPWQHIPYTEHRSIGRFEGDAFDPLLWKPRVPTAAFLVAQSDDNFWAARRVMAFTDSMIRAVVEVGGYSDPAAARHLGDVLIKRRDKIGRTYLPAVNPIVDVTLNPAGLLTFANAAVDAGVSPAPTGGYRARWYSFDNLTAQSRPIGNATSAREGRIQAPADLLSAAGEFIRVDIEAVDPSHASWAIPVRAYFRRASGAWKLVGFERIPDNDPPPSRH